ncbi:hypothetical protein ABT143_31895 [Streptomyces sp. NPDC002033]|uniref:hypothetical protein n=1 Tax=unclassified Streptomyces TaxID=2593676 RepID=UPI0033271A51
MTAYAKHLPAGATPASGMAPWGVEAAARWRGARPPAVFAPGPGSRLLAVLVAASLTLILWNEAPGPAGGTAWRAYPDAVVLVALPLWYRFLPGAAAVSAALLAVEAAVALPGTAGSDAAARTGLVLVCLLSLWALAGALLRLRARRAQARLALAAAGPARYPLPRLLPPGHDRRGNMPLLTGGFLCLVGACILLDGILGDLGGRAPYDAVGQQRVALPLLVAGATLLGRGWTADLAARRLHREPQPALVVGVRVAPSGHFWLYPDADSPAGTPLIGYRPGRGDTRDGVRLLARAVDGRYPRGLHDIDARAEPFEAVVHGPLHEGAEIVVEYAVHGGGGISAGVAAAPLLPRLRSGLDGWVPAGVSHRETQERRRERARTYAPPPPPPKRRSATTHGTAAATGTGAATTGGGCGGDGGCGSGCGGCGGCGCG